MFFLVDLLSFSDKSRVILNKRYFNISSVDSFSLLEALFYMIKILKE